MATNASLDSPGGLKRGLRLEDALAGQSEIRNKALALAFQYMKLIENWGTGLKRVQREITEFGLREPGFVVSDSMFRVNIYRMSLEEFGEKLHPSTASGIEPVSDDTNLRELANERKSNDERSDEQINKQIDGKDCSDEQINEQISARQKAIMLALMSDSSLSYDALSSSTGVSVMTIRRDIADLVSRGLIRRVGARKNGHWEVLGG